VKLAVFLGTFQKIKKTVTFVASYKTEVLQPLGRSFQKKAKEQFCLLSNSIRDRLDKATKFRPSLEGIGPSDGMNQLTRKVSRMF
jgi:hypothetical protein